MAVLVGAILWGAAVGTASASMTEFGQPARYTASALGVLLAKHGADDPKPQPCDDHGTDLCYAGAQVLAKHGADDATDPIDDNGVDFVLAKHGADDAADPIDDNGVDFVIAKHGADDGADPCDDHGSDLCLRKA
ncbi:MAG TPA: hypothetical protein VMS53_09340 [Burkholderiales bacterium]|nr:hypothetical protein [Burkholderiales bacterium]